MKLDNNKYLIDEFEKMKIYYVKNKYLFKNKYQIIYDRKYIFKIFDIEVGKIITTSIIFSDNEIDKINQIIKKSLNNEKIKKIIGNIRTKFSQIKVPFVIDKFKFENGIKNQAP